MSSNESSSNELLVGAVADNDSANSHARRRDNNEAVARGTARMIVSPVQDDDDGRPYTIQERWQDYHDLKFRCSLSQAWPDNLHLASRNIPFRFPFRRQVFSLAMIDHLVEGARQQGHGYIHYPGTMEKFEIKDGVRCPFLLKYPEYTPETTRQYSCVVDDLRAEVAEAKESYQRRASRRRRARAERQREKAERRGRDSGRLDQVEESQPEILAEREQQRGANHENEHPQPNLPSANYPQDIVVPRPREPRTVVLAQASSVSSSDSDDAHDPPPSQQEADTSADNPNHHRRRRSSSPPMSRRVRRHIEQPDHRPHPPNNEAIHDIITSQRSPNVRSSIMFPALRPITQVFQDIREYSGMLEGCNTAETRVGVRTILQYLGEELDTNHVYLSYRRGELLARA